MVGEAMKYGETATDTLLRTASNRERPWVKVTLIELTQEQVLRASVARIHDPSI